jgi:hypothetical protein
MSFALLMVLLSRLSERKGKIDSHNTHFIKKKKKKQEKRKEKKANPACSTRVAH